MTEITKMVYDYKRYIITRHCVMHDYKESEIHCQYIIYVLCPVFFLDMACHFCLVNLQEINSTVPNFAKVRFLSEMDEVTLEVNCMQDAGNEPEQRCRILIVRPTRQIVYFPNFGISG